MSADVKAELKRTIRRVLPLWLRKHIAIRVNRSGMIPPRERAYWATQLLVDFAEHDVDAYHKFLWTHHLAYAETYEIGSRFGYENFNATRKLLFEELPARLEEAGLGGLDELRSVFEVGCSLGYLLRYMETELLPNATRLEGIDIDVHAITEGQRYLSELGSKVCLRHGDMEVMDRVLGDDKFDLVLASGVLLYLEQASAERLVSRMLAHTGKLLVITALAHPEIDNAELDASVRRASDGTWVHNVDRMIEAAGGTLAARRWEGGRLLDGNTIYFLYALPASEPMPA